MCFSGGNYALRPPIQKLQNRAYNGPISKPCHYQNFRAKGLEGKRWIRLSESDFGDANNISRRVMLFRRSAFAEPV